MKIKPTIKKTGILLVLISLFTVSIFAATPASQAGPRKLSGGQRDFKWPVPGAYNMSSCFLDKREHYSLDIAAPRGTTVIASYDGTVIETNTGCEHNWGKSNTCCSGWGNYVLLKHSYQLSDGTSTTMYSRYAHLTDVSVSVGQAVTAGKKIGTVGSTGRSSGPHLDYEILHGGTYPSKTYSLDPYVNDLLELPEELHTTFGACCQEYVAYVKTLYPRCQHNAYTEKGKCTDCGYEYNWRSTWDCDAMGNYTTAQNVTAAELPYPSEAGTSLTEGDNVAVNGTVVNGKGETWYEVILKDNSIGYVPERALKFQSYFASKIDGALSTLKEGQTLPQESHRIDGTITSNYPLRKLSGYLDGKLYGSWSGKGGNRQLDLRGTEINKKLSFADLSAGQHTLTITAQDSTGREAVEVIRCTFYIQETFSTEPETVPSATLPETQPTTQPTTQLVTTEQETVPETTVPTTIPAVTTPDETQPKQEKSESDSVWLFLLIPVALLSGGAIIYWLYKRKEVGIFSK